jgi:hypothetical protein
MKINSRGDLKAAYGVAASIGISLITSVLIYAVIVELIKKQSAPFTGYAPMPDVIDVLRYTLLGVVFAQYFLIRTVNNIFLSLKRVSQRTYKPAPLTAKILGFSRLIAGAIIVCALCESVAIYGLVLFLIQGNSYDFYLFLPISLVYFAIFFPRYDRWEAWIKEREKAAVIGG